MHSLIKLFSVVLLVVGLSSCGGRACQECTGTNTNGELADFTVCETGEGTSRTNNLTGSVLDDRQAFAAAISFYESLGLTCE